MRFEEVKNQIFNIKVDGNITVDKVELISEGNVELLPGVPVPDVPEHLRICVTAKPEAGSNIKIEAWIPTKDWNGDMVGVGNGGAAGHIAPILFVGPVKLGFAAVTTDMGTSAGADCGINNQAIWKDFGYRATHIMTETGKELIRAVYGESPKYSYFMGGSTGGQQALSEAQRYPEDYDGIVACAPAYDRVNLHLAFLWDWMNIQKRDKAGFTAEEEKRLSETFLEEYGELGERQGGDAFFYRPDKITVTEEVLQKAGLNVQQREALLNIYGGLKDPETGNTVYESTLMPGSETSGMALAHRSEKKEFEQGYFYLFRWVLGADFDFAGFDFTEDAKRVHEALDACLNANNPDLSAFQKRGGKLLLLHGTADPIIPMTSTMRYLREVQDKMGDVDEFLRLFLIPGMGHISGGPGLQDIFYGLPATPKDEKHLSLLALKDWVEKGIAPEKLYPVAFRPENPLSSFMPGGVAYEREIPYYQIEKQSR